MEVMELTLRTLELLKATLSAPIRLTHCLLNQYVVLCAVTATPGNRIQYSTGCNVRVSSLTHTRTARTRTHTHTQVTPMVTLTVQVTRKTSNT